MSTSDSVGGVLLDTHVILWLASEPERCGTAINVLSDPSVDLWISAVSTWELAIKMSIGHSSSAYSLVEVIPSGKVIAAATITACQPQKVKDARPSEKRRV